MIRINRETLVKLYPSVKDYSDIFYREPKNTKELIKRFMPSKLWRLNNLYSIVDKQGNLIPFKMNWAQFYVFSKTLIHPRLIILKSRQQGISTFWLINFFDDAIIYRHLNVGLMSQGVDESVKLKERVIIAWENLDESIKKFFNVSVDKDNEKEFKLTNHSSIFIRTSFRSATLQRLHISELAKIANNYPDRAKEVMTGSLQTIGRNPAIIESTGEGDNLYKRLWNNSVKNIKIQLANNSGNNKRKDLTLRKLNLSAKDFYPVFLPWFRDPDCWENTPQEILHGNYFEEIESKCKIKLKDEQKWFWESAYRELGEEIYQEYPSYPEEAFKISGEGFYYATIFRNEVVGKGRLRTNLYDSNLPVRVAMDIGMNDFWVLVFYQVYRGEVYVIGEYSMCDMIVDHYISEIKRRGYYIEKVVLPHDSRKRSPTDGDTVENAFIREGFITEVLAREDLIVGRDRVKKYLSKTYFDVSCKYIIDSLENYKKLWDEKLGIWKDKPVDSIYNHGADAIRYMYQDLTNILEFGENKNKYKRSISGFEI